VRSARITGAIFAPDDIRLAADKLDGMLAFSIGKLKGDMSVAQQITNSFGRHE
jgi:hypothetical protein